MFVSLASLGSLVVATQLAFMSLKEDKGALQKPDLSIPEFMLAWAIVLQLFYFFFAVATLIHSSFSASRDMLYFLGYFPAVFVALLTSFLLPGALHQLPADSDLSSGCYYSWIYRNRLALSVGLALMQLVFVRHRFGDKVGNSFLLFFAAGLVSSVLFAVVPKPAIRHPRLHVFGAYLCSSLAFTFLARFLTAELYGSEEEESEEENSANNTEEQEQSSGNDDQVWVKKAAGDRLFSETEDEGADRNVTRREDNTEVVQDENGNTLYHVESRVQHVVKSRAGDAIFSDEEEEEIVRQVLSSPQVASLLVSDIEGERVLVQRTTTVLSKQSKSISD